jgi:hypothetical protein
VHALVVGLLLTAPLVSVGFAQDERRDGIRDLLADVRTDRTVGLLEISPQLEIGRIGPGELLGGGASQAVSMGRWSDTGATDSPAFQIETRLVRSVPAVWRMRVSDFDAVQSTNVRYALTAPDGRVNTLTGVEDPGSVIQALISPLPPLVVEGDLDSVTIEGGLLLNLDLRGVRTSGVHVGTLTVTIENF